MEWLLELIERTKKSSHEDEETKFHDIWDVLAVLRGPDAPDSWKLKTLTTGRVRAILGLQVKKTGLVITKEPLTYLQIKERNRLLHELEEITSSGHFEDHIRNAYIALKALGYQVPSGEMNFSIGRRGG